MGKVEYNKGKLQFQIHHLERRGSVYQSQTGSNQLFPQKKTIPNKPEGYTET